MLLVRQITTDPLQQQTLVLPDGSSMSLTLQFLDQQQGWFINNLTYGTFNLNGLRITNNFNMLNQWRNILLFGMACISKSSREPSLQNDFASGYSTLYILTQAETQQLPEFLQNGVI